MADPAPPAPPRPKPVRRPEPLGLPTAPFMAPRDSEGRSMAGRKRPLKINLDLALVSDRAEADLQLPTRSAFSSTNFLFNP